MLNACGRGTGRIEIPEILIDKTETLQFVKAFGVQQREADP